MDFEKLTIKSGEAVAGARELARRAGNPELTPDHLTIALLDQELPRTLGERAGLAPAMDAPTPKRGRRSSPPSPAARPSRSLPPPSGGVLDNAFAEASALSDEFVSVEHLLLALGPRPA